MLFGYIYLINQNNDGGFLIPIDMKDKFISFYKLITGITLIEK